MKAAWFTDVHLNFLSLSSRLQMYKTIKETEADVIFVTGDIAEAKDICTYMESLRTHLDKHQKVYFVAGNHDYYYGHVQTMREKFAAISHGQIQYLPICPLIDLTEDTYLIGVDGWADGRNGNYKESPVILNDSRLITDFMLLNNKEDILKKMQELADQDGRSLDAKLQFATSGEFSPQKIIILTHVPPFPESSLYEDQIADDDYLPFYTSKVIGDIIMEYAEKFTWIKFLVLCGHSHHKALYEPLSNLTVKTGGAHYYFPAVQEVFDI